MIRGQFRSVARPISRKQRLTVKAHVRIEAGGLGAAAVLHEIEDSLSCGSEGNGDTSICN
jgi:hypothetical protein